MPSSFMPPLAMPSFGRTSEAKDFLAGDGENSLMFFDNPDSTGKMVRGGANQFLDGFRNNSWDNKNPWQNTKDIVQGATRAIGGIARDFTYQPFVDAGKDMDRVYDSAKVNGWAHPKTLDRVGSVVGNGTSGVLNFATMGASGAATNLGRAAARPALTISSMFSPTAVAAASRVGHGVSKTVAGASNALKGVENAAYNISPKFLTKIVSPAYRAGKGLAKEVVEMSPLIGAGYATARIQQAGEERDAATQNNAGVQPTQSHESRQINKLNEPVPLVKKGFQPGIFGSPGDGVGWLDASGKHNLGIQESNTTAVNQILKNTGDVLAGDGENSFMFFDNPDSNGRMVRGGANQLLDGFRNNSWDNKNLLQTTKDIAQGAGRAVGGTVRAFSYQPFLDANVDRKRMMESYNNPNHGLWSSETLDRAGSMVGNTALGGFYTGTFGLGGLYSKLLGKTVGAASLKIIPEVIQSSRFGGLVKAVPEQAATLAGFGYIDKKVSQGSERKAKVNDEASAGYVDSLNRGIAPSEASVNLIKNKGEPNMHLTPLEKVTLKMKHLKDKRLYDLNSQIDNQREIISNKANSLFPVRSKDKFFKQVRDRSVDKVNADANKYTFGKFMDDYKYPIMGVGAGLGAIGLLSAYRNRAEAEKKKRRYARLVPQRSGLV